MEEGGEKHGRGRRRKRGKRRAPFRPSSTPPPRARPECSDRGRPLGPRAAPDRAMEEAEDESSSSEEDSRGGRRGRARKRSGKNSADARRADEPRHQDVEIDPKALALAHVLLAQRRMEQHSAARSSEPKTDVPSAPEEAIPRKADKEKGAVEGGAQDAPEESEESREGEESEESRESKAMDDGEKTHATDDDEQVPKKGDRGRGKRRGGKPGSPAREEQSLVERMEDRARRKDLKAARAERVARIMEESARKLGSSPQASVEDGKVPPLLLRPLVAQLVLLFPLLPIPSSHLPRQVTGAAAQRLAKPSKQEGGVDARLPRSSEGQRRGQGRGDEEEARRGGREQSRKPGDGDVRVLQLRSRSRRSRRTEDSEADSKRPSDREAADFVLPWKGRGHKEVEVIVRSRPDVLASLMAYDCNWGGAEKLQKYRERFMTQFDKYYHDYILVPAMKEARKKFEDEEAWGSLLEDRKDKHKEKRSARPASASEPGERAQGRTKRDRTADRKGGGQTVKEELASSAEEDKAAMKAERRAKREEAKAALQAEVEEMLKDTKKVEHAPSKKIYTRPSPKTPPRAAAKRMPDKGDGNDWGNKAWGSHWGNGWGRGWSGDWSSHGWRGQRWDQKWSNDDQKWAGGGTQAAGTEAS